MSRTLLSAIQALLKERERDPNQAPLALVPPWEPGGGGEEEKRWKQRGSDIKSSESNNFNNIVIKVIRIRHKLVKQGMTVKQVGKTKQTRGIFWR